MSVSNGREDGRLSSLLFMLLAEGCISEWDTPFLFIWETRRQLAAPPTGAKACCSGSIPEFPTISGSRKAPLFLYQEEILC